MGLWEKVQTLLSRRSQAKTRVAKHDFAFARLVTCGHCGCALVGEVKKGRYVYYHCTGFRGKCPEPYVREEVLAARFAEALRALAFDGEVIGLVREALRQGHEDARRFHDQAVTRLQAEYTKLQGRVDRAYEDKLDGVIEADFFERKSAEWRSEQARLQGQIDRHRQANQTYLEEGVQLLELAQRMPDLFARQGPREQRRLLDFVLSNCTWAEGRLSVRFRQPFDLPAVTSEELREEKADGVAPAGLCLEKLPE